MSKASMHVSPKAKGAPPSPGSADSESMRKLRLLKDKITKEFEHEHRERTDAETREAIIPLSLASEYAAQTQKKAATKKQILERNNAMREKIASLRLAPQQRSELESEIDKRGQEMTTLKAHNARLRDMVQLRQECNVRREGEFEDEIKKLKGMDDAMALRDCSHDERMEKLRQMNVTIQQNVSKLKSSIEEQAEAEKLSLIRTYRVKIREIKQHLQEQQRQNLDKAQYWIDRHDTLVKDRNNAADQVKMLEERNDGIVEHSKELRIMTRHQEEQREAMVKKIAIVRRENSRLQEQIGRLETQVAQSAGKAAHDGVMSTLLSAPEKKAMTFPLRATSTPENARRTSGRTPQNPLHPDRKNNDALTKMRRALEDMRNSLKQVRSAHIELLQERTELEIFLRQCIEDVRRDMYRFTVVNTLSRNIQGDQLVENDLLEGYGSKDKKKLSEILNSKLRVLTQLHEQMFPSKEGRTISGVTGYIDEEELQCPTNDVTESAAELDMDHLWTKWKQWTQNM